MNNPCWIVPSFMLMGCLVPTDPASAGERGVLVLVSVLDEYVQQWGGS